MQRGVNVLVKILALASLLGLGVILLNPEYRGTAAAMLRGEVEASPIWQSNADYYREVHFNEGGAGEISE